MKWDNQTFVLLKKRYEIAEVSYVISFFILPHIKIVYDFFLFLLLLSLKSCVIKKIIINR